MIKIYIKTVACLAMLFIVFACANEPIQIQKQVVVTVSPSQVLDNFVPYKSEHKEMDNDTDLGKAKLRITALLYDESGRLIKKNESLLNDYNSDYTFSVAIAPEQEYTLLCFSSSIFGSLEEPELESYEFSGVENLSTLKVTQLNEFSFSSNWTVLGTSTNELYSVDDDVQIYLSPATSFVYLYWRDIHANDSDRSGVYTATAEDYSGEKYTWEIEVEQLGDAVVVKNISPFFSSLGVNSEIGSQLYYGYVEDGYIIIPSGSEVGFEYGGVQATIYGVGKIEDNTIFVDDIYIKIGNGKLTFENGFATYIDGNGWLDIFEGPIEFTSLSGEGIDRYGIIYHNNDILTYNYQNGFYYNTTLDAVNNNGDWVQPMDFPDAKNIYSYVNFLPGEFSVFARTLIGNERDDYSMQDIIVEAGKQYYLELDCASMKLALVPGLWKSESLEAVEMVSDRYYRHSHRDYVSLESIPFVPFKGSLL